MTKTEQVRQMLQRNFSVDEIMFWTKVSRNRVYVIRWLDRHPDYKARKMAEYRKAGKTK